LDKPLGAKHFEPLEKGIHILIDMYNVKNIPEMTDAKLLESFCESKVLESGLTQVGKLFYKFPGENSGITGAIIISESHATFHSWPELNYVTIDVFVCNVQNDNRLKARMLAQSFIDLFQPEHKVYQEIERN